jgi:predicted AlkP superfamily pyrophosphatase or phosphodiesterase
MRSLSLLLALLLALVSAPLPAQPAAEPPRHARHVVIVSIDGLMPETYLKADEFGLKIPNLRRLMREGAWARGVVGVLPTVTYPSHTTLITGLPPRLHGIGANSILDPEGKAAEAWYWFASDIRVPTLVSAARERKLSTAAISWPVSIGLGADWNLPEFWRGSSSHPVDLKLLDVLSTPGLIAAVEAHRGRPFPYPLKDEERADTGVYVFATHRPNLFLLHIFELDTMQHRYGPRSPEAFAALEKSDAVLGRLLAAIETAGLSGSTLFAVVSDHGFLPVTQTIQPNTLLRDAGLLKLDDKGKVKEWKAWFNANGGSANLHLKDAGDKATLERIRELLAAKLADAGAGLQAVLDSNRIEELGGIAEAALVLDARSGFSFSNAVEGGWLTASTYKGNHGYAPDRPELYASFLVTAPGLTRKGDLGVVPMTSIAPTVARYLGLTLSPEAGPALPLWSGAQR